MSGVKISRQIDRSGEKCHGTLKNSYITSKSYP